MTFYKAYKLIKIIFFTFKAINLFSLYNNSYSMNPIYLNTVLAIVIICKPKISYLIIYPSNILCNIKSLSCLYIWNHILSILQTLSYPLFNDTLFINVLFKYRKLIKLSITFYYFLLLSITFYYFLLLSITYCIIYTKAYKWSILCYTLIFNPFYLFILFLLSYFIYIYILHLKILYF